MKRMIALAIATLLALAGSAVVASPAQAAAAPASCPSTHLCVYVDNGYATGEGYMLIPVRSAGTCVSLSPFRNAITSAWNSSGRNVRFYRDTGCANDSKVLYNGTGNGNFYTHWGPTWNDTTDAVKFL